MDMAGNCIYEGRKGNHVHTGKLCVLGNMFLYASSVSLTYLPVSITFI